MGLHSYGVMGVDWEERVRHDRLREERLARITALLAESELGALLCFDMSNIRYITATHIGTWAQDKLNRFCLLPQGDAPIMWDFGSAARHHQLYNPWLGDGRSRAGISTMRGAMSPESGRAEDVAEKIRVELEQRGLLSEPVGIDAIEPPVLFALQRAGVAGGRRPAAHAAGAHDQDPGRDHAAQHGLRHGGRGLRGALPDDARRHPGERLRRAGQPGALRDGVRVRRGRQRHLGRALQPPSPRLHRPRPAPRGPGLLRHPSQLHGLPHVLLPHVRGGQRIPAAGGRLQALPLLPRCRHRPDPARRQHRARWWRCSPRPRSSASPTRRRRSRCSSATASG